MQNKKPVFRNAGGSGGIAFDGRLDVKPHKCACGVTCHCMSPAYKEKWASGITKELDRVITYAERGLVSHPKTYLLFEIWKIINRAIKEFPSAQAREELSV